MIDFRRFGMLLQLVLLCFLCSVSAEDVVDSSTSSTSNSSSSSSSSSLASSTSSPSTHAPLKCTRDYHCPSKCDTCRSGICSHPLNLNCTRDYHCPSCEVCRSGKCVEGVRNAKTCTSEDVATTCEPGEVCLDGKCGENQCEEDDQCGERAQCKFGKCVAL